MTPWLLLLLVQAAAAPPATGAAPEGTLTLAEAVALARVHSPLAAAARAQAEGAEKAAKAAGRLADPTLDLRLENWRPGADDFVASTDLDMFAVVTQPLDLFTRGGRKAQARGESDEAVAGRRRAEEDVQLDTVRRFLETWRGRDLVAALEGQSENLAAIVAAMEKRVAEGYAAEADLLRFRAEAARAANHLARARTEHERAEAELAFLVGKSLKGTSLEKPALPPRPGVSRRPSPSRRSSTGPTSPPPAPARRERGARCPSSRHAATPTWLSPAATSARPVSTPRSSDSSPRSPSSSATAAPSPAPRPTPVPPTSSSRRR